MLVTSLRLILGFLSGTLRVTYLESYFNGFGYVQVNADSLSGQGGHYGRADGAIEMPFTYTNNLFTVFSHGDHVFNGEKNVPIGRCCADIMNVDEKILYAGAGVCSGCSGAACRKNRHRRSLRTGEAKGCLGRYIIPGIGYGQRAPLLP